MTTARRLITADELLGMPDDGYQYELVRGALIKTPPPGFTHTVVTGRIGRRMGNFVEERGLGFIGGPQARHTWNKILIPCAPQTTRSSPAIKCRTRRRPEATYLEWFRPWWWRSLHRTAGKPQRPGGPGCGWTPASGWCW